MVDSQSRNNGPRMMNQIGKDADDSRVLVDMVCRRVIKPKFDEGVIPGRVEGKEEILAPLGGHIDESLLNDSEWAEICQRVHAWQDKVETCSGAYDGSLSSVVSRVLQNFTKFPTENRVRSLLGEEMADMYRSSLETIEKNPELFALFPDERVNGGWSKQSAERAASLVIDVLAPHGSDPSAMSAAHAKYMEEYRSQAREKSMTHNVDCESRKIAARNLGIWLPIPHDLSKWENDPRTADRSPEFQRLVIKVVDKMRVMRSVLQYIPRRRFSNHTVDDMDANMNRMRLYIRDSENRDDAMRVIGTVSKNSPPHYPPPSKRRRVSQTAP